MTNHPTTTPPPASANGQTPTPTPGILDRFRAAAEEVLVEAKNTIARRDQLKTEGAHDIAADRDDAREEEQAARALEDIRARRRERHARMAQRNQEVAALDAEATRLETEGQQAVAYITQWEQAGQVVPRTVTDGLSGRPIGTLAKCPGCPQPISWDGLGWTHGTVTDCTADLSAVDPQQNGGASA